MTVHTRTAPSSVPCFRVLHFDAPPFSFLLFPTLASLFAHFHHGRKGVADGVSIDLSKWDNKQPRECNEQKQKRLPRKQTQHGRRTTKQTVAKAAPAHHALLQNNMYCPFICPSILFFTRVHAKRFKATTCARAPPPSRHPDHLHPRSHPCGPHCRDPRLWMRRQRAASQTSPASSRSGWA